MEKVHKEQKRKVTFMTMEKGRCNRKYVNLVLYKMKQIYTSENGRYKIIRFFILYTFLFLITFILACSPFIQSGKSFIWSNNDGHSQHYPVLVYVGRYLRKVILSFLRGEGGIPLFDLNLAMGGDIISTLNYYGFGNPLYLFSVFVPTHYTEMLFNVLVIIRLYFAGIAFCWLCTYHKKLLSHAMIGALIYVFSGYMVHSAFTHPCFLDPMIQLPILLIGIDMIIQRKRPFVFILSAFYSALCGFYFLYMMTIMLGVYALIRFFDCYTKRQFKEFIHMIGRIGIAYACGIGLAAPLFLPAIIGYLNSGRTGGPKVAQNYLSYGWDYYRNNFLKLIAPPGSWTALTLAAIVLFSIALLLSKRKKNRTLKILLAICVLIYAFPLGGYVMNGFSYPIQRWTFGAALLLAYITVEMLPDLLNLGQKQQILCLTTILIYSVPIFTDTDIRNIYHVVASTMLTATLMVLLLIKNIRQRKKQWLYTFSFSLCVGLIICNVSVNTIFRLSDDQYGWVKNQHKAYGTETDMLENAIECEAEPYIGNLSGRIDSSSFSPNVGAVWRIPTMYTYWSILNRNTAILGHEIENSDRKYSSHAIWGMNERPIISTLFSTQYFVERKDKIQYVPFGYSLLKETTEGNMIYENRYALPWGYTYDDYITIDQLEGKNGIQIEEAMLHSIVLERNIELVPYDLMESDIQSLNYQVTESDGLKWEDGILTVNKNNATMTLEFQMPREVNGYLRLQKFNMDESGVENACITVTCDDIIQEMYATSSAYTWHDGRENYLVNLGYSEEERRTCVITFPKKGTFKLEDIEIYVQPFDNYPAQIEALREEPLENIEFSTNRITGTVDLSKNKILCMSIPYSKGWSAKVDGKPVEILWGNIMFMAIPLETGYHDIEFNYFTPGLKLGIVCSLISVTIVIAMLTQDRKQKEHRNEKG